MKARNIYALIIGLLLPVLAQAQKTDIVILENGDRITGEIKKLEAGILQFSTDTMGTVNIEWRFISRLISDKTQSIEMTDGTRILGSLQRSTDELDVVVATQRGPLEVNPRNIVSAWPVQATFKDRMDLDFSVGFDYQKATDTADLNGAIDFRTKNNDRVTEASLRTYVTRRDASLEASNPDDQTVASTNGKEFDQTRFEIRGMHEYLLPQQRFRNWFGKLESNDALGVDLRVSAGGSFGKYLLKTNNKWFSLAAGLLASEEIPDTGPSETNLEAVGSLRYRYFRFADPERSLDLQLNIFPSLTDSGRYRTDLRTTFKLELVRDFFWALELYHHYDSAPLSEDLNANKSDYGLTTSIGWSY
jgi:hypothetical protein